MPEIHVTDRSGDSRTVQAEDGLTVMEALRENGFDELTALCGGCCSCATCHIYVTDVTDGVLSPPGDDEDDLLDSSDARRPDSRLSCQIRLSPALDGLRITIAPED